MTLCRACRTHVHEALSQEAMRLLEAADRARASSDRRTRGTADATHRRALGMGNAAGYVARMEVEEEC